MSSITCLNCGVVLFSSREEIDSFIEENPNCDFDYDNVCSKKCDLEFMKYLNEELEKELEQ